SFAERLVRFEEQGWFSSASYKKSQGLRVRRGTIVGILALVGCGIYTLLSHKTLDSGPRHWEIKMPFTAQVTVESFGDVPALVRLVKAGEDESLSKLSLSILPSDWIDRFTTQEGGQTSTPSQSLKLDRFAFRDLNNLLTNNVVKVVEP